ncbi:mitotic checkpoint regulator, MAD2B-interacting-domain-containing protein [Aspergillus bertholletiae]|uniref:Mitotic checkpoint regulator, MAD2B-interacting-domain-containing protein n=1 Tax=Aspergillus bertholletiae TaxID=1226010 RepID=A0A5N7B9C7_9EURO|nr:mitotic checkpoint regulator, MAD2B-interacting-domain-containing protein [Aspergillus bertholletiae]
MALVSYSDSEGSDSEPETTTKPTAPTTTAKSNVAKLKLVDSSNPRKIRVALDLKPEDTKDGDDGPARKKVRIGGGGGFAGFNSFLPAPKKAATTGVADKTKGGAVAAAGAGRKVFSLKTGAAPGFDRGLDEETRNEWALEQAASSTPRGGDGDGDDYDGTIPKAGSLRDEAGEVGLHMKKPDEVKLKGNPMMFKPLSVGRGTQKRRKVVSSKPVDTPAEVSQPASEQTWPAAAAAPVQPPAPKPKVSLFSLGSIESAANVASGPQAQSATYEPLVYTANTDAPAAGPQGEHELQVPAASSASATQTQTLDNIADDLNLSRSQRRHLFGRNADASKSRVLHFNTDQEYIANQEMAHQTDMAAVQHNPVRAIAPGKHTLQQLVNAASSQREALEESFASGRRNKKEAGSKYGW